MELESKKWISRLHVPFVRKVFFLFLHLLTKPIVKYIQRLNILVDEFIGNGEVLCKKILLKLLNCIGIEGQVNIQRIVSKTNYDFLDEELQNHNFDLVMRRTHAKDIVIEVNYKHGEKIAAKIRRVLKPMVLEAGYLFVEINDWECDHLFWLNTKKEHPVTWNDFVDVVNALKTADISPDIK